MKTISVIATQTLKSYARDRLFYAALIFSVLLMLFCYFLSSLTIFESRKILLDFGLSAISMMGIAVSLFLGITLVGKEIEKRTIYTVLSKPISRNKYLMGKLLGASAALVIMHLLNATTLWFMIHLLGEALPQGFFAANYLMILESILILGLSLFLSLYTSSLILASSLSIAAFLIGRSSHTFQYLFERAQSASAKILLRVMYDLFPSLDRFNIREVVAYSKPYPESMVQISSLYFMGYFVFLFCLSLLVFRKKDLT